MYDGYYTVVKKYIYYILLLLLLYTVLRRDWVGFNAIIVIHRVVYLRTEDNDAVLHTRG